MHAGLHVSSATCGACCQHGSVLARVSLCTTFQQLAGHQPMLNLENALVVHLPPRAIGPAPQLLAASLAAAFKGNFIFTAVQWQIQSNWCAL